MALVSCEHVSSDWMGHQWLTAGAVVEMSDDEAKQLLDVAGLDAGYAIVGPPPAKRSRKAVSEPAPASEISEVTPEGSVTEGKRAAAKAATAAEA